MKRTPEFKTIPRQEAELAAMEDDLLSYISGTGMGWSYTGAFFFLVLNLIIVFAISFTVEETLYWEYRSNILLTAVFWLAFSWATTFRWLRRRPGPPSKNVFFAGLKDWAGTLKKAFKLRECGLYLIAYLIFSDGVNTVAAGATTLAVVDLQMDESILVLAYLEILVLACIGTFVFMVLSRHPRTASIFTPRVCLLINLVIMTAIPIYAMFALTTQLEFFIVAGVYGVNVGAQAAFARQIFAQLIPAGHSGQFYGIFAVTDKGTSWLGPLILAAVTDATGDLRIGIVTIVPFFIVGTVLLLFVKIQKGVREALLFKDEDTPDYIFRDRAPSESQPVELNEKNDSEE